MFLVYWENTLVAMFSTLNLPSGTNKYGYRVHRTVVLPDFQGLGIGTKLLDFFGEWYLSKGEKLYLRSTHLRFANHCINSNKWIEGSRSQKSIKDITVSQGNKRNEFIYRIFPIEGFNYSVSDSLVTRYNIDKKFLRFNWFSKN